MKKQLLLVLFFGYTLNITAQFNYAEELNRFAQVPNSPEAEEFMKYGNTPVNLYTGGTNVEVPIYNYKGQELNLPISLTYNMSSVKVGQIATNVGLGWNLNVGGRISRNTNGLPDDFSHLSSGSYETLYDTNVREKVLTYINTTDTRLFDTEEDMLEYFNFIDAVRKNEIDTQCDYYSLNVMGLNETIVMDINNFMNPVAVNNPRVRVEKIHGLNNILDTWIIYGEDGTKYEFEVAEQTITYQDPIEIGGSTGSIINQHNSSWLLTRIESPNKKDIYEFEYVDYGFWTQEITGDGISLVINTIKSNQTLYPAPDSHSSTSIPYVINQQFLSSIKHNGSTIMSCTLGDREDSDDPLKKIESIVITNNLDNQVQKVAFNYTCFGDVNSDNSLDKQLKLDGLSFSGSQNSSDEHTYSFEYIRPEDFPSRSSFGKDVFGYYNGANNQVLYTTYSDGTNLFSGANRDCDANFAEVGLLNKITYPTKGYTTFNYEGHEVWKSVSQTVTDTKFSIIIQPNELADANDFLGEDGNICDDAFLEDGFPRFKIAKFSIPEDEQGFYRLNGNNLQMLAIAENNTDINVSPNNYCNFVGHYPFIYSTFDNNINTNFPIESGNYIAMILSTNNETNTSSLELVNTREESVEQNVAVGGVRIQTIEDYDANQQLINTRTFSYVNEEGESTGELKFEPIISQIKSVDRYISADVWGDTFSELHRYAYSPTSADGPHISYGRVIETQTDELGNTNGHTTYSFNQSKQGAITRSGYPFQKDFFGGYQAGSIQAEEVFDQNSNSLYRKSVNSYIEEEIFVNRNLVVHTDQEYLGYRLGMFQYPSGQYSYERIPPSPCSLYNTGKEGEEGEVLPGEPWCIDSQVQDAANYIAVTDAPYGQYTTAYMAIQGVITEPSLTTTTQILEGNEVTTTTIQEFDSGIGYLLRETQEELSNGDTKRTKFYYPKDFDDTVYTNMYNTYNRLNIPIKIEQYINDNPTLTKLTEYQSYGGTLILPKNEKVAKANSENNIEFSDLEERLIYHDYDDYGNPLEVSQTNGSHTMYIWGYNHQYPIAKIENASYTGISTSASNLIESIQTASNTEDSESEDDDLRGLFDDLRDEAYFQNAMITSYTYDPLVGVTSITDPKGYTMYYEYDDFQRLEAVKDADGNLLSTNEYNYKN